MNIKGKIVTLRALELSDVDQLNTWSNDPGLWSLLGGWHFPYSKRSTQKWVESIDDNNMKNYVFGIENEDHKLIGTANLINIDWKNKNAFHGMMIGDSKNRGKFYALDTVMLIMKYSFLDLGLERLDGDMIKSNMKSVNFYTKKCGWVIEGEKENWFYRNGLFYNKVMVGITKNLYLDMMTENDYWNS